jgi:large subunit ribosomal protein L22|tara:strand:+ start:79 stop:423 length:345 start_codon:yes stop_codon:yes gene_type:complete
MENKEVKAINKMIRSSTQKVNLIVKDIRKKKIAAAINILKFSQKRVSKEILKTVNSAIANAENNNNLDIDKLVVKEVYVGKSIRLKRFNPQSKGRAHQIIKPYSRLTVILEESL